MRQLSVALLGFCWVAGAHLAGRVAGADPAYLTGVIRVTDTSASDEVDLKVAQALCPRGTKVIGGGALAGGSSSVINVLTLVENRPMDPPTQGWVTIAYETIAAPGNWHLSSTAICADLPTVLLVTEETSSDSLDHKQLFVECPAGTRILGGGVQVIGPLLPIDLTISESRPRGGGSIYLWESGGREWNPTAISWSLRAHALCADIANSYQLIFSSNASEGTSMTSRVECPDDTIEIGHGAEVNDGMLIAALGPFLDSSGLNFRSVFQVPDVLSMGGTNICIKPFLFGDGFASGDLSSWSSFQ